MKELAKRPVPGAEKGLIYSGRCAGGTFNGTQVLMIAADDEALGVAWEALQGVALKPDLVYDVSVIGMKRLDALLPPASDATPTTHALDVE